MAYARAEHKDINEVLPCNDSSGIKVEKREEGYEEFYLGYKNNVNDENIVEKSQILKNEFLIPLPANGDLPLDTTNRGDRGETTYFRQKDEPDFTITAESILVKEEYLIQDCKKEVKCPSAYHERRAEYNSSLEQPEKLEIVEPTTSLHLTDTEKTTLYSKTAERHAKSAKAKTELSEHNCCYCAKSFKRRWLFERHVRFHNKEKTFECNEFRKHFSHKHNLRVHMRIHVGERPHSCTVCSKAFTQKIDLNRHTHIHTGDRPYKCRECRKAFIHKSNFHQHMRIHTGDRPYKCSECPKAFTGKTNFCRHMRIHTGDRPYKCSECPKAFIYKTNLDQHMRIHTGDRPYKCSECSKGFSHKGNLNRHMSIHTCDGPYK